jgi:hypothetical protein
MPCSLDRFPAIAAFLAGRPLAWPDLEISEAALLALCDEHDVSVLCFERISRLAGDGWPDSLCRSLRESAHTKIAVELLRANETRAVLDALAVRAVEPILIKGTALAYTVYDTPACRGREDTDLFIRESDIDAAREVMAELGYTATVHCSDLFAQFEVQKADRFGVVHAFDIHWKISTQPVFQSVLTHAGMLRRVQAVPALGVHARCAGPVDALLLACVHPVMHHRNLQRVAWIYDVHLLASRLSSDQASEFAGAARRAGVAAVCAHQLRLARAMFGTRLFPSLVDALSAGGNAEPSAAYLASERTWRDELASSLRGVHGVGDRINLLRGVLLPSPRYMLGAYGLSGTALGPLLLPALYVHRNVRGAWKILTGKK